MPQPLAAPPKPLGVERFFENARGVALRELVHDPKEKPRAVLLFVHGMGEDSLTHEPLGLWLAPRGVAVRLLDLEGFGGSGGERGHIGSFGDYLEDLALWARRTAGELPGVPLYLGGHSFGSAVAGLAAQKVESERPGFLKGYLGASAAFRLKSIVQKAIARANPGQTRTKVDGAGEPEKPVEKKSRLVVTPPSRPDIEPTVTRRFAKNFDLAMEAFQAIEKLPARVLVLCGEKDPVVDAQGAEDVRCRLNHPDLVIRRYEGRKHNLLHGSRREETYKDILEWILSPKN